MPTPTEDCAETLGHLAFIREIIERECVASRLRALDAAIAAYEREPVLAENNAKRAQKIISQSKQIAQLRTALEKRDGGDHNDDCDSWHGEACDGYVCDCGHDEARRVLAETEERDDTA